jgi:hypothetical protein
MSEYLYANFLHDPEEYAQAQEFWKEQWQELISGLGEDHHWVIHSGGTFFADGTPCRDGNPIFSAVSLVRGLGIRIIQVEPNDNPREFGFWTDKLGEDDQALSELVIACVLTRETTAHAKNLITDWVTKRIAA